LRGVTDEPAQLPETEGPPNRHDPGFLLGEREMLDGQDAPGIFWNDEYPDGDFDLVDDASVADDMATWQTEVDTARSIAAARSLDDTGMRRGAPCSLRWIYVHMIEEYARHNGHADLLRECIDGATGD
jgi:hypothetical protein